MNTVHSIVTYLQFPLYTKIKTYTIIQTIIPAKTYIHCKQKQTIKTDVSESS